MSDAVQRVYVTTIEGQPSILVHAHVRDEFISETVERLFGVQEDGEPHKWAAYDVRPAAAVVAEEAATVAEA